MLEETANDLNRELSRFEKNRHFNYVRANHALRALSTRKILRSKDAQCKTEGSPKCNKGARVLPSSPC